MLGPNFENRTRLATLIAFFSIVIVAPLIGAFAFSPLLVASGIQPYPLAAAMGCMAAEAIAVAALVVLAVRSKK
jgi:hypothetical protein